MLETLRNALKSWPAKMLILLLVASFAFWGIGDVFSGRGGDTVAYIGETELSSNEFARAVDRRRVDISQQAGRLISFEEFRSIGIDRQILGQLVREKALAEEARVLGISAPDEAISADIREMYELQGTSFSGSEYREQLSRAGFTVAEFEELTRADLAQRIVTDAVARAAVPPEQVAEMIARRRGETRRARTIRILPDDVEAPGTPDDTALEAWFADRRGEFTAPERRSGRYVLVEVGPMIPGLIPDEAAVRAEYEARIDTFSRPETRDIDQVVLADAAAAEAAMVRLAAGEITFEELAAEQGLSPEQVAFGEVTPDELQPALAEAIFATREPGLLGPVETGVGYAVIRINAAADGMTIPFEVVGTQLGIEMGRAAAVEAARDKAVEVEDLRAASVPFEEIAERAGVAAGSFASIDTGGIGTDNLPEEGLPRDPALLGEIFAVESGDDRDMIQLADGSYALVLVEEVESTRPLTFEEAREAAIVAWRAEETARRLDALGARLAGFADGPSGDLRAVAAGRTTPVGTVGPFDRYQPPEALGQALTAALFEAAEGDAVYGPAPDGDGVIVAELAEVIPADDTALAEAAAEIDTLLADSMAADTLEYFGRALEARFEAGVDPAVIETVFNSLSTGGRGGGDGHAGHIH